MSSLSKLRRNWEGLAQADPFWAICVDPARRAGRWTAEELLETGRSEIKTVLDYLASLNVSPNLSGRALDFGCGVGRLTGALAGHFSECWGVDISPTMIELAEELHRGCPRCNFCVNETDRLPRFPDAYFELIYTSITLQHIPRKHAVSYLREFARVLRPDGILVFQIPDADRTPAIKRLRNFIGLRRKWKRLLGSADIDSFQMPMHCIPEAEIRKMMSGIQLQILDARLTNSTEGSFNGNLRFLENEPREGYVSKQYCTRRAEGVHARPPGQAVVERA
jgi:SAM-dependent methyltransferase